jgi:hypothetical protein
VIGLAGACVGLLPALGTVAAAPGDFAFDIPIEASGPQALCPLELPQVCCWGVVREQGALVRCR